jgi:hypothetical protein
METSGEANAPASRAGLIGAAGSLLPRLAFSRAWALFFIVLFALMLFSATAAQPFHLDNVDFPAVARQVSETGLPYYYRGEELAWMSALYHPPLYIYSLAAWIHVFGFGPVQVRMFGFACALAQAIAVLAIIQALVGKARTMFVAPLFLALFLLNPYTLQTVSIADIDSTIYGPVLCAVLLAAVRIAWRNGTRRTDPMQNIEVASLALLVALALWCKLTTVLLLFPALPLLLAARVGRRKAILLSSIVVAAALTCFFASYWLYGLATGLDVGYSVRFTIDSFLHRGSSGRPGVWARVEDKFATFPAMAAVHLLWTGSWPWVVATAAFFVACWRAIRNKSVLDAHIAAIVGVALATTVYYCGQTLTFGSAPFKYTFVFWGVIMASPALLAWQLYGSGRMLVRSGTLLWTAGVFVLATLVAGRLIHDDLIFGRPNPVGTVLWHISGLLAAAAIATAWKRKTASRIMYMGSMAAFAGMSLGVALHQANVLYSTTYDYGQMGFADTVGFIRANTEPNSIIASMKDIGFAADRRYFENYFALYGDEQAERRLEAAIAFCNVEYAVFTEARGQDQLIMKPSLQRWIEDNTVLVRSFGNYRIYRPKAVRPGKGAGPGSGM